MKSLFELKSCTHGRPSSLHPRFRGSKGFSCALLGPLRSVANNITIVPRDHKPDARPKVVRMKRRNRIDSWPPLSYMYVRTECGLDA